MVCLLEEEVINKKPDVRLWILFNRALLFPGFPQYYEVIKIEDYYKSG
jgi:hypothetical protein